MNKYEGVKVMIGIPTMSYIHTFLVARIMAWWFDDKVKLSFYASVNTQPVDRAREEIVQKFLESDCTHLFFVDSDTIPNEDSLYKMLDSNEPIISGLTPIVAFDRVKGEMYRRWNAVDMNDETTMPMTGIKSVKGAGGACLLIKREVFEKMKKPYFRNMFIMSEKGNEQFVSEDIYFIAQSRNAGFDPKVDTSIVCQHYKETLW